MPQLGNSAEQGPENTPGGTQRAYNKNNLLIYEKNFCCNPYCFFYYVF